jgi:hypothetical protein
MNPATALDAARTLADTVLFEGYMLYPYRANDAKNAVRWQFGVLAPPSYLAIEPSERDWLQTDCLVEGPAPELTVRVRFLHVQQRTVEEFRDGAFEPVESLDLGQICYLPCEEAIVHETTRTLSCSRQDYSEDLEIPDANETESLRNPDGEPAGRLVRRREPLRATLSLTCESLPGPYGVRRIRLRLANTSDWQPAGGHRRNGNGQRPDALRHALVAAHLLMEVSGGAFVSLLDPPEWARGYVEHCEQFGVFPVLAGPAGDRRLLLASPIILYDHAQVAPESASQFCDATEMDEMLTLRTSNLTEQEKREVRGSDPRAAALLDEVDNLPAELLDRLHGAIRGMTGVPRPAEPAPDERTPWWADDSVDPDTDLVLVDGVPVSRGSAVRLRPGRRRADAHDMFLDGRTATVQAVLSDLDGGQHLAVTLDDLAELAEDGINPHGRFLYFAPDEVEPIGVHL